jgi:hypothetical protein
MDEEIKINGEGRQLPVKYNQKRFAEGYGVGEKMDEEIRINGEGRQLPVKFHQKRFAQGYGDREEFGESIWSKGPSAMVRHSYAQNATASTNST